MRTLFATGVVLLLAMVPVFGQETRGTISGTVHDAQGVLPGASVKVTNVDTNVAQSLVTNGRGYFEAPLLVPGNYRINVELTGFKALNRTGITLAGGQQMALDLGLELGAMEETVTVTGEAPLLETNSVRTGASFSQRQVENLPVQANQPLLLARFAPGLSASGTIGQVLQGQVQGPSGTVTPIGGVGSNEYSIDGASNNGINGQIGVSPNGDMVQEMRVESTSFTASTGHGVGVSIAMMTRAGTNTPRGTLLHQLWTNKLNGISSFRKATFDLDPAQKAAYQEGHSNNFAGTYGGPLTIPGVVDGRNKLFFFGNVSYAKDSIPGGGNSTVPRGDAGHNHLAGDFSDLLLLPNSAQFQIYDPLTTRPDPARPGHVVRDPFIGNIIPADRITNPLYKFYSGLLPTPNQNPTSSALQPVNNYITPAQPYHTPSWLWGTRVDYNASQSNRFFFRGSGNRFYENIADWLYQSARGVVERNLIRTSQSGAGTWTHVAGQTVLDAQFSVNRFAEKRRHLAAENYGPSAVGLPGYLQDFCAQRDTMACMLPMISFGANSYRAIGPEGAGGYQSSINNQAQFNYSQVRGSHTLKGGVDARLHKRTNDSFGTAPQGNFTFDNTYTRKADDTVVSPASQLGLSWAAFMLGVPTTVTADNTARSVVTSPYLGTFVQDTWRVSQKITLSAGLRYEYENGIGEMGDQMITGFDPTATLAIAQAAQAAYAVSPIPELPVSAFKVAGGPLYASDSGQSGLSWRGHSLWMPRVGGSWSLNDRTVFNGGYGLYYDSLNSTNFSPNQLGYSATTTSVASVDFGQTWRDNPRTGAMVLNPFPVRADGTRFDKAIGSTLGANTAVGTAFSFENPNRVPARVQRWRAGVQRQFGRNYSVEVAVNHSAADRVDTSIRQDFLPEQYYNGSNVRDLTQQTLLNANVTNPFFIGNFASLQTSNPALYSRMAGNAFFTSPTIQRNRLLRAYPQMSAGNGLVAIDLPLGKNRAKSIEISFNRRYANGFSAGVTYTGMDAKELRIVEEYERVPTLWQPSQESKPHRVVAQGLLEFPFGNGKRFMSNGGVLGAILGGWQVGAIYEYQPGALLEWPSNIFFYGNLSDIAVSNPTRAQWFNVDAGFEKDPAKVPASFQKRSFPFRVDGVRADSLSNLNVNFVRNIRISSKELQFRVNILNALAREQLAAPSLDPTSTQFGTVTAAASTGGFTTIKFVTFLTKFTF